jgi:prepilin-type N-terminal cleavage/methylation domain-containing protein
MFSTRRRAFTLVEMLIVLGIIAVLTAIAFPVFNSVRRRSYGTTCASNLKQLGLAANLYAQDYDGLFPRGGDPVDLRTDAWHNAADGVYEWQVGQMPPLTYTLRPYLKSPKSWACPADEGFEFWDISGQPLDARPSSFGKFGMSYYYRTELTLKNKRDLAGWDSANGEHGASDINVLADGSGAWHGQDEPWSLRRYNVLMGDGRVANLTRRQYQDAWALRLDGPTAP